MKVEITIKKGDKTYALGTDSDDFSSLELFNAAVMSLIASLKITLFDLQNKKED